jgi:hypothetical protein
MLLMLLLRVVVCMYRSLSLQRAVWRQQKGWHVVSGTLLLLLLLRLTRFGMTETCGQQKASCHRGK